MKPIFLLTLLSFSLYVSGQSDPISDTSLKLKDSILTKDFTPEDSIASANYFNELEAKKAEMAQMALLYPKVHSKVNLEFSGVFYPEPDYALYNLRLKKDDDFNLDQD